MRFHQIKESSVLIKEQQLYSAPSVAELFYMSLRLIVAKHPGAKVLFFCLLSFSVCSAVPTVVAQAKCLVFSCVQPKQTTVASARDNKHILFCAPKHFLPGSPRLHKALIWLYVESHELATETSKTDIYLYVGRKLVSLLNKVKCVWFKH